MNVTNRQVGARWQGHPLASRVLRVVAMLLPAVLAIGAAWIVGRQLPAPESLTEAILAWVMLSVLSTIVLVIVDRFARRLLPLAALLKLSLAFPERAPSRYRLARATGSTRQLAEEVEHAREHGLSSDRTQAAESVLRLVAALSTHDAATRGHAERVRVFTDMIAVELELEQEDIDKLRWVSLLHDVGKIAVHPEVLNKPDRPSEAEWELLRQHPIEGARIIAPLREWLGPWALAVEQHHERYDGAGYPFGLAGEEISLGARIVCVADAYDVMTAARAYKDPMLAEDARAELAANAGSQFDPMVVRAFLGIAVGRLRWAVGPLSWLANTPLARPVPTVQGLTTLMSSAAATAVGVAAYGVVPDLPVSDVPELEPVAEQVSEAPLPPELPALAVPTPEPEPVLAPTPVPVPVLEPPATATPVAPVAPPPAESPAPTPAPAPADDPVPTRTNSPPVAAADEVLLDEDLEVVIDVLANDVDLDGDTLVLSSVSTDVGEVELLDDGRVRYRPPTDWSGLATISYVVSDGVASVTGLVSVDVRPANDAPVTRADTGSVLEDASVTVDLLANDRDVDGDTLRVVRVTGSTLGAAVTLLGDGTVTYTPGPDRNGVDELTYTVTDGTTTTTGVLRVNVSPVNDAPRVVDASVTGVEDEALEIDVVGNASDVDGDELRVTGATSTVGSVTVLPSGRVRFVPPPDFAGPVLVTYVVADDSATAPGSVRVTVTPVQDPPVAGDDALVVIEDAGTTVVDVLANDTDPDDDTLAVVSIDASSATLGTATVVGDTVRYTPSPDATGTDTLTYVVSDGGRTATGTLRVTVLPVNDAPVVGPEGVTTTEDTGVDTDVLGNDTDVDGDTLSVVAPVATVGTVSVLSNGVLRFTPPADWSGDAVVDYAVTDGTVSVPASLAVQVLPVNDAPTFTPGPTALVAENAGVVTFPGWATDITAGAADEEPPAQTLGFAVVPADPSLFLGVPTIDPVTGALTFTTRPGASGSTTLTIELADDGGTADGGEDRSIEAGIITLDSVDDPPVAGDDAATLDEDTSAVLDVLANDSDPELVGLTVTAIDTSTLAFGGAVDNGDGTITYAPLPDVSGVDTMTYTVSDGVNDVDATITFTIDPVDDAPVVGPDSLTVDEDAAATVVDLLGNDTDADGDTLSIASIDDSALTLGSVADNGDGTVTYTPDADTNGTDVLTYVVTDGALTDVGTLTVTVTPINDAPVADDEVVTTDEDVAIVIDVLDGDADVDGDTLTVASIDTSGTLIGSVVDNGDGTVTYTPDADANGDDAFTYTVSDGTETDVGYVGVTVLPVQDVPVAVADSYATDQAVPLAIAAGAGVLANDTDADGDPLTVSSVGPVTVTPSTAGTVTMAADGSFLYAPGVFFAGVATFAYQVTDGIDVAAGTVTIDVASLVELDTMFLSTTSFGFGTNSLSLTPPPSSPGVVPDHAGDGDLDPGLTIEESDGAPSENDTRKFHQWVHRPSTPLTLFGPVSLDLYSAVAGLEGDTEVHPYIYVSECDLTLIFCSELARTDIHVDDWGPAGQYSQRTLPLGNINATIPPTNLLVVKILFEHEDVWLPLTGEFPSSLTWTSLP